MKNKSKKKMKYILLMWAMTAMPLKAELPLGKFDNMSFFPETGDEGGYEITLKKTGSSFAGELVYAAGERQPAEKLQNITCNEKTGSCEFKCKTLSATQNCSLLKVEGGVILFLKADKKAALLAVTGKPIAPAKEDAALGAVGVGYITGDKVRFRGKPSTKGEIFFEFSRLTKVGIIGRTDDYKWTHIVYKGKIGYVANEFITE